MPAGVNLSGLTSDWLYLSMALNLRISIASVVLAAVLVSCQPSSEAVVSLGSAHVGVAQLQLHAELEPGSATSGELAFGETVQLLRRRRNFYFVRNDKGVEGWTHRSSLFNERQVAEVNALARYAESIPAQGQARVYELLNVHNYPNRSAPSIFRIQEQETVSVITHEWHERGPYDPGALVESRSADTESAKAKEAEAEEEPEEITPPDPPRPPSPPQAWLKLSGLSAERISTLEQAGLGGTVPPAVPHSGELWTLVRNAEGLAGWALNSRLSPALPDKVAQYAEGARVMSYFSLGEGNRDGTMHHWLWTTMSRSSVGGIWDSIRVFAWNSRLARYETVFIQRGVEGYLPVEVTLGEDGKPTRFTVIVRERTGAVHRKIYEFHNARVRLVQSVPFASFDPRKQGNVMEQLPASSSVGSGPLGRSPGVWDRFFRR